ncbi:MAG: UDP-N-acetylmuramate dehydrogenase [Lachnospiraceae bacterium]|nr:UDP-N-acetylmuramate dehydrogenase [Lachnospiraceae bacterium]
MERNKKDRLIQMLQNELNAGNVYIDEPLSRRTTFRIGGKASVLVVCENEEQLRSVLHICDNEAVRWFLLGNGSNVLVADEGYDGVIIKLSGDFCNVRLIEEINEGTALFVAGAGMMLTQLSLFALKKGFTGLEFAHGIPGTVGGAVFMNAGAYGGEIKQTIYTVKAMKPDGSIVTYSGDELGMGYRKSRFTESDEIVLEASFRLKVYHRIVIRALMEGYKKARIAKQPLDVPSAGSTFKRPEGAYAGALIEQVGLKGYAVGGAAVSKKHAGFVVNNGNATCADVLTLVNHICKTVKEQTGYELEPEIRLVK